MLQWQDFGKPEPFWMEVFQPLLDLVAELENQDNNQKVQVCMTFLCFCQLCKCYLANSIFSYSTTTQIFPKLLVLIGLQDLPFKLKCVDYCIYLSQSKKQEARTQDILVSCNIDIYDHSIN